MASATATPPALKQSDIELAKVVDDARTTDKCVFLVGYVKYDAATNTNRLHCFRQTRNFPTQDINEFMRMAQEELSKDVTGGSPGR